MFCPNCGKSDQTPDSYCRSCGEFLTDFSAKSYLINRLLGGSNPRTQIKVNLTLNVITWLVSSLLLGFLKGYYDAEWEKTGAATPGIIYLVYAFLGLVMLWQFMGFIINLRLKKKLDGVGKGQGRGGDGSGPPSPPTQRTLSPATLEDVDSVNQRTTKILDKLPRR